VSTPGKGHLKNIHLGHGAPVETVERRVEVFGTTRTGRKSVTKEEESDSTLSAYSHVSLLKTRRLTLAWYCSLPSRTTQHCCLLSHGPLLIKAGSLPAFPHNWFPKLNRHREL
jgi:hypothetical protein